MRRSLTYRPALPGLERRPWSSSSSSAGNQASPVPTTPQQTAVPRAEARSSPAWGALPIPPSPGRATRPSTTPPHHHHQKSPLPGASCAQAAAARKSTNHLLLRAFITMEEEEEEEEEGQPPPLAFTPGTRSATAALPMGGQVVPAAPRPAPRTHLGPVSAELSSSQGENQGSRALSLSLLQFCSFPWSWSLLQPRSLSLLRG